MTNRVNAIEDLPVEERLAIFGISADVMDTVRGFRPIIVADLPELFAMLSRRVADSPALSAAMGGEVAAIRDIEAAHILHLFDARFDSAYFASAETAARGEYALGLGARTRLTVLSAVAGHLLKKIALRSPFWAVGAAEKFGALLRALMLDCSIAMLLHEKAAQERLDSRHASVEDSVRHFGGAADRVCGGVSSAATQLITTADLLGLAMEDAYSRSHTALTASEHVSGAMQEAVRATTALEHTLCAVQEDARVSARSSVVTAENTGLAQDCVAELSECAAQIGSVTDVIGAIAAQTNLLSLNATIEAARAGASGRSFAIVAGEVKELAGRTAQATIEVRDMVEKIQDAARRSVDALALVSSRIQEQRELCERIEAAVIAQSSSTSQIRQEAGSVANAASATLAAIKAIQATVASAQAACEETKDLAGGMSADSEVLSTEFREFASQLQTR
jgi:hypothetical protein